ncbi:MAG: 4-hydroxy-3-methylbut-2-enyl diphosphate reductase [Bacteroidales bacterium]|nr:MAG: 4-hydroxy-3-methylbut-2-enyl diphosphate reductase [Bacteroidales bacterium]
MNKLNLKIEIDENSGFCFGVTNAINKAEEVLDHNHELYCLGELVHNEEEIARLQKKGLKIIHNYELKNIKNTKVLFRAHGEPPESYKLAEKNNNNIIDASCPTILKIQKLIKEAFQNNENIYIYGKHNHPEIIGLTGQVDNKAIVFEDINELKLRTLPEKLTLFSQTTKDINSFYEIVDFLKQNGIDVKVQNTICRKVYRRQKDLKDFAESHDKIILVAGKNSSNGKVLYNECKKINPDSYFISSVQQINKQWFKKNESIGICGATSTPMWLMKEVEKSLKSL